jgi:hypothetical protein
MSPTEMELHLESLALLVYSLVASVDLFYLIVEITSHV